ncbi:hypothetical protein PIB30_023865 [Stylosanthes scabra]|uniref:Uncharacterized protein n=1 Tax=Stylosanthes scabra TaxID=79078 RepID=A0ABU6S9D1_9FABA|nr:hypothetical protein [Stylosanthes scabra]
MGSPCTLTEDYLTELKRSGVICGGGEEERLYRVELPRRGERVMFIEFGVRIPFSNFQQRLLQRCFVAPSQFHPKAWSAIRCFELVTEFLKLPQDPEVVLFLFTVFSPNADGKAKKGYMSVRPGKGRRIFGLYEESFHDIKGRYFKVFPVGDHPPFWLTLERDAGRFPSYWSKNAGVNYVPVSYRKLNEEQSDTADVLLWLFSKRNLKPKAILGNPERARATIGRRVVQRRQGADTRLEVSSPIREERPERQVEVVPPSPQRKRTNDETTSAQKRTRTSEDSQRDFCPMDRSFDASGYIESNFMGPHAREVLLDYDPMESLRSAQWAMLRSATIMKFVEPRLTVADQWERRCVELTGNLKMLNQQKADVEKEKDEAQLAKAKAEKDLESVLASRKEKDVELQRLRDRVVSLLADTEGLKKKLSEEKARADKVESSLAVSEEGRQELIKIAQDSVKATEDALKEQILVLAPDFDVSLLGAWKEVVDG